MLKTIFYSLLLAGALSELCYAQISEVRAGITEYDEKTVAIGWGAGGGRENSIGLNAEVIFNPVKFIDHPLAPRPYIGGMLNLSGETSYIGAGVIWRANLSKTIYADLGIGIVLHDGTRQVFTQENLRSEGFNALLLRSQENISLGSVALFKPQLTFGYQLNDKWAVEVLRNTCPMLI